MIFRDSSLSIVFFSCLFMAIVIVGKENSNICNWIKCENDGICQNVINSTLGYQCRCPFGFTGLLCENRFCLKNPCLNNGICIITNDRIGKCICSKQYTGVYCETLI